MTKVLKTTLATAFAAACLAGAGVTFAADNHGGMNNGGDHSMNSKPGSKSNDGMLETDPNATGSIKCHNSNADVNSGCDKPGMMKQDSQNRQQ